MHNHKCENAQPHKTLAFTILYMNLMRSVRSFLRSSRCSPHIFTITIYNNIHQYAFTYWKPSTMSGRSSRSRPLRITYGHNSSRAASKFSLMLVGRTSSSSSLSTALRGECSICCGKFRIILYYGVVDVVDEWSVWSVCSNVRFMCKSNERAAQRTIVKTNVSIAAYIIL